jgi:hypothetical protein
MADEKMTRIFAKQRGVKGESKNSQLSSSLPFINPSETINK